MEGSIEHFFLEGGDGAFCFDKLDEELCSELAHFEGWLDDGCEGGVEDIGGYGIGKTDHSHFFWHFYLHFIKQAKGCGA